MMDKDPWSSGRCRSCRGKFGKWGLYKGKCLPCRRPKDRRELVAAGVPWGSADALALIMKKCKTDSQAQNVLQLAHPRLMSNIVIVGGVLKVRDKKYHWIRRGEWMRI